MEGKQGHSVELQDRTHIHVTGVDAVISFDDLEITLKVGDARMTVEGRELHIGNLSLETGIVSADGYVTGIYYTDRNAAEKRGLFRKKLS